VKRKTWILFVVLVLAVLLLSGCGVSRTGVEDLNAVQPEGLWQTLVVWPLAKSLVWLNAYLMRWGVPYHWGFAIILFTVIIKVLTLPLTITQMRGMAAQRAIQPRIQELQKKYGNDRNKLSQEQMKLYQEAGVNPLSGCLPLLIQMPILFGLYAALVAIGPYLKDASFFWIPDLSFPTAEVGMSWITKFFTTGQYGLLIAYLVLPVMLIITQFVMQKYMTPTPVGDESQGKMTQQITLVMTLMFGFFTLQVPAGLTLYWVTSNLLQMGQQYYFMRRSDNRISAAATVIDGKSKPAAATSPAAATGTKPPTKKPTTVKSVAAKDAASSKGKASQ
jgi:YidC/Oxa1 family membrane protein insertase